MKWLILVCLYSMFSTFTQAGTSPSTTVSGSFRTTANTLPLSSRFDENDANPFLLINNQGSFLNHNRSSAFLSNNNLDDNLNVNTNPQFYNIANNNEATTSLRSPYRGEGSSSTSQTSVTIASSTGSTGFNLPVLPPTPTNLHYLRDADGEAYRGANEIFIKGLKSGYGVPVAVGTPSFSPALTPTTRPCSTAHIVHTSPNGEDTPPADPKMFTATKF